MYRLLSRVRHHTNHLSQGLLLVLSIVIVSGCATTSTVTKPDANTPATQSDVITAVLEDDELLPAKDETSPYPSQFSRENLYKLLVAEMAGQRGELDLLVKKYTEVAESTRDLGVIKRAINAAQYAKQHEALTRLAQLWSKEDPDSVDAHQLAAFQLIKDKEYSLALTHMERVLELEGPTTFDRLALHAKNLEDDEKNKLLGLYYTILERHPDNGELLYGYAVLQELNGQYEDALDTTDKLLQQMDNNPAIVALRARLIKQVSGIEETLAYLKVQADAQPEEMQIGTLYGRTLIEAKDFTLAQDIYRQLLERFPDTPHLRLSYGLIALENKNYELAKEQLSQLVEDGQHLNEAHFYLGRIADQDEKIEEAISHYQQVNRGGHYFNALARSGYLLIQAGRPEEAAISFSNARQNLPAQASQLWELEINLMMELENHSRAHDLADIALEENPKDLELRYARAMIRERLGLIAEMEEDLRNIIDEHPDNSIALNALGYTLADRTNRLDEAYQLISKALQLDPENPAILDSMGWILYRLNKPEEALEYLRRAYSKFPDPEVAAHLGEVLWVLGRKEDALVIWKEAHESEPDHRVLTSTLERLDIDL